MTWADTSFILPEIVISIGASLLLIAPVSGFRGAHQTAKWSMLALLAITAATLVACSWAVRDLAQSSGFAGMFALDAFAIRTSSGQSRQHAPHAALRRVAISGSC